MKKKENIQYTGPLTGVEEEFAQDVSIDSVHDALQGTWNTENNEQKNCAQELDTQ
ncbi:hypothetical protein [Halalkalibacter krulwichiae]|uniref:DUF4025 domain-containing protein n=1 Tax=Halalkalibacter krulwichiae TaxID=199441 RepID=A0A1X9MLW6_9BACI|nr:hypothetical protein [Halalkalibacter krulwichiae]ARK31982.1 hypothetical protein BkAM31D_20225 [Halalkalibacter krulwichiae]